MIASNKSKITSRLLVVASLTFSLSAGSALAQNSNTCSELRPESWEIQGELARMVSQYPGTTIILGMCAAAGQETFDNTSDVGSATGAFAVCAGFSCALAGFDNCKAVAVKLFALLLRHSQLDQHLRELGCN